MSGPTTAIITADPASVLLAAAVLNAAQAVYEGYAEADRLAEAHKETQRERSAQRREADAAAQAAHQALLAGFAQQEARVHDLLRVASRLGLAVPAEVCPARPEGEEPARLAAWSSAVQALIGELEALLRTESARREEAFAEEDLAIILPPSVAENGATGAAATTLRSRRWLSRIEHLGELPEEITRLARELDATEPGQRAELLVSELRRRIQIHAEKAQQEAVQTATSSIVEATLRDLGYQVDGIGETLFVEGGVAHFRRASWGDYMVRLRAEAGSASVNFNVVRAVDGLASGEAGVLDHLAEDRWCAEFPTLLRALEARGVQLTVTRRLEAGELPVQRVLRDRLPRFAEEEEKAQASPEKAMEFR